MRKIFTILFIPMSGLLIQNALAYHNEIINELDSLGDLSLTQNVPQPDNNIGVNKDGENAILFDPSIAEVALAQHFEGQNLNNAIAQYEELASKNQGYLSARNLMKICLAGHSSFTTSTFLSCKNNFIKDMIEYTRDAQPAYTIGLADFNRFNQSCTPAIKYTDGRVANLYCPPNNKYHNDPAFQKAWATQLRIEAPVCSDVGDGAGITCFGVTERYFADSVNNPEFSIHDAQDIAYGHFYKNYKFNQLPDALRGDFFSTAFNQGNGTAKVLVKTLQSIVGTDADGYLGPKTFQAIKDYKGPDLRQQITAKRWALHKSAKGFDNFGRGWAVQDMTVLEHGCQYQNPKNLPILNAPSVTDPKCNRKRKDFKV
ncbi:MAG: hypothetical protein IJE79_05560 [Alphaproteobacteria bacterium]|nr:hypothetical protein [Alphaproteobacteria bacterium]